MAKYEDASFYYIVMELADEDLSQVIIKQKALAEYTKEDQFLTESYIL